MKRINRTKPGFTLAEVLITLVIIGVIAAITVPTMIANSRKTEVETKLKQTLSIFNNALTRAVADNGPINSWEITIIGMDEEMPFTFFNEYLKPYLNFAKLPEKTTLPDFGYKIIKKAKGGSLDATKDRYVGILNNGITIIDIYHYWDLKNKDDETTVTGLSDVTFLIDINGLKSPNYVGKDVFGFTLHLADRNPHFEYFGLRKIPKDTGRDEIGTYWNPEFEIVSRKDLYDNCKNSGEYCGALIQKNGFQVPKDYPHSI